jgi:hypothetical protein
MRLSVVLATLALSFGAPVFITTAEAARPGTPQVSSHDTSCKKKHGKKSHSERKSKKKGKEAKKPYGFEL